MTSPVENPNLLGQFIPLHYHYQMLLDQARMQGFKAAIERIVPAGGTVLELGGGTGVLSFFASSRAAQVYCVERNPQMVQAAKSFLAMNSCAEIVEVIEADAMEYVPREPVDVVICEMLHSALLREKQIQVIDAFKRNYRQKFPAPQPLPAFIPEATILAAQAVCQDFNFLGYRAPLPMFFEPTKDQPLTQELSNPVVYSTFEYKKELPFSFSPDLVLEITKPGLLNAVRFVTKNVLAVALQSGETIDWHNFYLVLPLNEPVQVALGQRFSLAFSYEAGQAIDVLAQSMTLKVI